MSAPASSAYLVKSNASVVALLPVPAMVVTLPSTSSIMMSRTLLCSSWVKVADSPVVPTATKPSTSLSINQLIFCLYPSSSTVPSSCIGVTIATAVPSKRIKNTFLLYNYFKLFYIDYSINLI